MQRSRHILFLYRRVISSTSNAFTQPDGIPSFFLLHNRATVPAHSVSGKTFRQAQKANWNSTCTKTFYVIAFYVQWIHAQRHCPLPLEIAAFTWKPRPDIMSRNKTGVKSEKIHSLWALLNCALMHKPLWVDVSTSVRWRRYASLPSALQNIKYTKETL